ncbi:unnamed protein product [Victoria cruziana]
MDWMQNHGSLAPPASVDASLSDGDRTSCLEVYSGGNMPEKGRADEVLSLRDLIERIFFASPNLVLSFNERMKLVYITPPQFELRTFDLSATAHLPLHWVMEH